MFGPVWLAVCFFCCVGHVPAVSHSSRKLAEALFGKSMSRKLRLWLRKHCKQFPFK